MHAAGPGLGLTQRGAMLYSLQGAEAGAGGCAREPAELGSLLSLSFLIWKTDNSIYPHGIALGVNVTVQA